MTEDDASTEVAISVVWPDGLTDQAQVVNNFAVISDAGQGQEGGIYLLVGHIGAPLWPSPEVARERLAQLGGSLPVQPRGSFFMSRKRAEELWTVLAEQLGKIPRG